MEYAYGRKIYIALKDAIKPDINAIDILKYISNKELYQIKGKTSWSKEFNFTDIKYEHIVCVNDKFYRKIKDIPDNSIELKEIVENNKIWYNFDKVNTMPSLIINCIDRARDIIVLGCKTTTKNTNDLITHGTGYRQLRDASYAPYNFYGNWFVYFDNANNMTDGSNPNSDVDDFNNSIFGESMAYLSDDNTNYFYTYNLNNEYKFFKLNEEKSIKNITYLLIYIMYFDIAIGSYLNKTISEEFNTYTDKIILFCDNYTIRNNGMIEKYNYTIYKNNLDLTKPSVPFNSSNWTVIRGTDGDGDKPIAAKLCDTNSMDNTHLKIAGWYLEFQNHLMLCNPKNFLINKNVYIFLPNNKKTKYFLEDLIKKFKIENNITDEKLICYKNLFFDKLIIRINNRYYDEFNRHFGNNIKNLKPEIQNVIETKRKPFIDNCINTIVNKIYDVYVDNILKPYFRDISENFIEKDFNESVKGHIKDISIPIHELVNIFIGNSSLPRIQTNNDAQIQIDVNNIINNSNNIIINTQILNSIFQTINLMIQTGYNEKIINNEANLINLYKRIVKKSVFKDYKLDYMFNKIIYTVFESIYNLENEISNFSFDVNYVDTLPEDYLKVGGYKQKYLKYKQKYLQLKNSLL